MTLLALTNDFNQGMVQQITCVEVDYLSGT